MESSGICDLEKLWVGIAIWDFGWIWIWHFGFGFWIWHFGFGINRNCELIFDILGSNRSKVADWKK